MKNPFLISLLALSISAVGLGAVVIHTFSSEARPAESTLPVSVHPDADLLVRVQALSEENRQLRERIARLELLPARVMEERTPVGAGFVAFEEFEAFREEVRKALVSHSALAGQISEASPEFKATVADTVAEIQHERAIAGARAYQEKRLDWLDEIMPKTESWLELSSYQSGEMRSARLAQYEREADLVRRCEAGEDNEVLGEQKAADRASLRSELALFLTSEQLETYLSSGDGSGK